MPVYLELFHGRKTISEQLGDWGSEGPILGPFNFVHTTYACDIKLETTEGLQGVLQVVGEETPDLLYYQGSYYGDWTVFGAEVLENNPTLLSRVQPYDPARADLRLESPLPPAPRGSAHETQAHC